MPSPDASVPVTLHVTQLMGADYVFRSACVRLENEGAILLTDLSEMAPGKTAERHVLVTPGKHRFVAFGEWKSVAYSGAYKFVIKTSHELDTSKANLVSLTFFETDAKPLQDRPKGRWTEESDANEPLR